MPSKTSLIASAVSVTAALLPTVLGAPDSNYDPTAIINCQSLGSGPLGIFEGNPPIYQPTFSMDVISIMGDGAFGAQMAHPGHPAQFQFMQCDRQDPLSWNKGSVVNFQGSILAPDGKCVTVDSTGVKAEDCRYTDRIFQGGVVPEQHFQFQKSTLYDFVNVEYLWNQQGPIDPNTAGAPLANNFWNFRNDGHLNIKERNGSIRADNGGALFHVGQVNPHL